MARANTCLHNNELMTRANTCLARANTCLQNTANQLLIVLVAIRAIAIAIAARKTQRY